MSNVRIRAEAFFKEHFGRLPSVGFRASKLYPPEESSTKSFVWWFEPSLDELQGETCDILHLLCEKEDGSFFYLKVPTSFTTASIDRLDIRKRKGKQVVDLLISAESTNLFQNLRPKDSGVSFAEFVIDADTNCS